MIEKLKWIEITILGPGENTGSCVWPESDTEPDPSDESNDGGEDDPEPDHSYELNECIAGRDPPQESEETSAPEEQVLEQTKVDLVLKCKLPSSEAFDRHTVEDGLPPIITLQFKDKSKIRVRIAKAD